MKRLSCCHQHAHDRHMIVEIAPNSTPVCVFLVDAISDSLMLSKVRLYVCEPAHYSMRHNDGSAFMKW